LEISVVAAVYYARAQNEPTSREKSLAEANSYIEKSIDLSPDDFVNLMSGASGIERIGDSSSRSCPYYAKATEHARSALAQLKGDSVSAGGREDSHRTNSGRYRETQKGLNDKIKTKCPDKP
jgi:hypothetical protein